MRLELEVSTSSETEKNSSSEQDYANKVARIPDYYENKVEPSEEYQTFPETRLWIPSYDEGERNWSPSYVLLARSALTILQESIGIPNGVATENACSSHADQYISNSFHYSHYAAEISLRSLMMNNLPKQLTDRWSDNDVTLFQTGLQKHGKQFFLIKNEFLPHKTTNELVEFYYNWKRSKAVKGVASSRARGFLKKRKRKTVVNLPPIEPMMTRSRSRQKANSLNSSNSNSQVQGVQIVESTETTLPACNQLHGDQSTNSKN